MEKKQLLFRENGRLDSDDGEVLKIIVKLQERFGLIEYDADSVLLRSEMDDIRKYFNQVDNKAKALAWVLQKACDRHVTVGQLIRAVINTNIIIENGSAFQEGFVDDFEFF